MSGLITEGNWKLLHEMTSANDTILCICIDEIRNLLFCGCQNGCIKVWSFDFYEAFIELNAHKRPIISLHQPRRNRSVYIYSISMDFCVRIYRIVDQLGGKVKNIVLACVLDGMNGSPLSSCFDERLDTLWIGCRDTSIIGIKNVYDEIIYQTSNKQEDNQELKTNCNSSNNDNSNSNHKNKSRNNRIVLSGHQSFVNVMEFNSTTNSLYSGSADGKIRIWYSPSEENCQMYEIDDIFSSITAFHMISDRLLISGESNGWIRVWDVSNPSIIPNCIGQMHAHNSIVSLYSLEDDVLVSSSNDGFIEFWNMFTYRRISLHNTISLNQDINEKQDQNNSTNILTNTNISNNNNNNNNDIVNAMCFQQIQHRLLIGTNNNCVFVWSKELNSHIDNEYMLQYGKTKKKLSFRNLSNLDDEVYTILSQVNGEQYIDLFEEHEIDKDSIFLLTERDLELMNIPLGPRRKIARLIRRIEKMPSHNESDIVESLSKFINFQTISINATPFHRDESMKAIRWLQDLLEVVGSFETKIVILENQKNPILLARRKGSVQKSTNNMKPPFKILFYGHYDIIDARKPKSWQSNPFELKCRNGFLYGRGCSDNKGPILAMIYALKEVYESERDDFDAVLVLEGEEEAGTLSSGFPDALLTSNSWLTATGPVSIIVSSNSYWLDDQRPCIVYGMRGVIKLQIQVDGPLNDLHSGVHGGIIHEPLTELIRLLGTLIDSNGKILIDGFYDDVDIKTQELKDDDIDVSEYKKLIGLNGFRKLLKDNKDILKCSWCNPSLSISNVRATSNGASIIAKSATSDISIRTVPNQNSQRIVELVKSYIDKKFKELATTLNINVKEISTGQWWLGDPYHRYYRTAADCVQEFWGQEPSFIREGGTIPAISLLEQIFKAPAIQIPLGQHSDNAHMPNERLRLRNLIYGKRILKRFISTLIDQEKL